LCLEQLCSRRVWVLPACQQRQHLHLSLLGCQQVPCSCLCMCLAQLGQFLGLCTGSAQCAGNHNQLQSRKWSRNPGLEKIHCSSQSSWAHSMW
jgi:hypothetical protein